MRVKVKLGHYQLNESSSGVVLSDARDNSHITICMNHKRKSFDLHKTDQNSKLVFRKEINFETFDAIINTFSSFYEDILELFHENTAPVDIQHLEAMDCQVLLLEEIPPLLNGMVEKRKSVLHPVPAKIVSGILSLSSHVYPVSILAKAEYQDHIIAQLICPKNDRVDARLVFRRGDTWVMFPDIIALLGEHLPRLLHRKRIASWQKAFDQLGLTEFFTHIGAMLDTLFEPEKENAPRITRGRP